MEIFNLILIIVAGFGAGIVTGLAGASAATIITPLLSAFGVFTPYTAITVALLTDVFASASSAITYKKNGNIKIKDGICLSIFAVIGAIIGGFFSANANPNLLGSISSCATLLIGVSFYFKSNKLKKVYEDPSFVIPVPTPKFENHKILASIFLGLFIGLICGIVGAGGGMMILFILVSVLAYDTKTAVGTSVLIMTFTALFGGLSHIPGIIPYDKNLFLVFAIIISSISGVLGAQVAAKFANSAPEYKMLRIVSVTFVTLAIVTILVRQLS